MPAAILLMGKPRPTALAKLRRRLFRRAQFWSNATHVRLDDRVVGTTRGKGRSNPAFFFALMPARAETSAPVSSRSAARAFLGDYARSAFGKLAESPVVREAPRSLPRIPGSGLEQAFE
jgi:hypothetical protein